MSKTPPNFRYSNCCEYCKSISWINVKDAWCIKHEIDLNPAKEVQVLNVCDDFEESDD